MKHESEEFKADLINTFLWCGETNALYRRLKKSGRVRLVKDNGNNGNGYGRVWCGGRRIYYHRLVYALANGTWPHGEVDHIDGNPRNNKPDNLRDVDHQQNLRNQKLNKRNSSGVSGVYWHKAAQKWMASITLDGVQKYLGLFTDIDGARAARIQAQSKFGFHENHGGASEKRNG